jgi:hypothetical protein
MCQVRDDQIRAVTTPVGRAQAAAWSGLRECRTALLESRVWSLESQIYLGVAGSTHADRVEKLAEKIAHALEYCEAAILFIQADEPEGA